VAASTPPDEQVSQVRELIRRIEADMDDLSDTDRAQIRQAVTAIRAARQTVTLGMPAIRPAAGNR
jgi:DNA-binding MurR/RpiR family transcriptional regulator